MYDKRNFKNREPKNINLVKCFLYGTIFGIVFSIITGLYVGDWIISPLVMIVGGGILFGVIAVKLRKWLLSTFWI